MDISTNIHIADGGGFLELNPDFPWFPGETLNFPFDLEDAVTPATKENDKTIDDRSQDESEFEKMSPKELGREGERLAATYLTARGYDILARNWRCKEGEIDIVCEDDEGTVVLVEVKSRYDNGRGAQIMPELAVDNNKQRKLARLALWYVVENPDVHSLRFDVIAINVLGRSSARIRHLVGAFTWDE